MKHIVRNQHIDIMKGFAIQKHAQSAVTFRTADILTVPEAIPCPYTFHKSGTLFPEAGRYAEMHLAEKYRLRMDFLLVHDRACCQSRREMSHIAQCT